MDPDQALSDLREIFRKSDPGNRLSITRKAELLREAAEIFEGLDDWMTAGGFKPRQWMVAPGYNQPKENSGGR